MVVANKLKFDKKIACLKIFSDFSEIYFKIIQFYIMVDYATNGDFKCFDFVVRGNEPEKVMVFSNNYKE